MNDQAYEKMKQFITAQTEKGKTQEELEEIAEKDDSNSDSISGAFVDGCDVMEAHYALRCRDLLHEVESLEKTQYIKKNLK